MSVSVASRVVLWGRPCLAKAVAASRLTGSEVLGLRGGSFFVEAGLSSCGEGDMVSLRQGFSGVWTHFVSVEAVIAA